jgi:hypothetical protein
MIDEQREQAIRRIRAKREFWMHVAIYLAVNAFLVVIWAMSSADYFWPVWPILGWGIAIVAHAVRVFGGPAVISEERIQREMQSGQGSTPMRDEF